MDPAADVMSSSFGMANLKYVCEINIETILLL